MEQLINVFVTILLVLILLPIGIILSRVLRGSYLGPFTIIINILAFFGVIAHEVSHFIACMICRVPISDFRVIYRHDGRPNPHGYIRFRPLVKLSFAKAFFIGFAPLLCMSWMFFYFFSYLFDPTIPDIIKVLAVLICMSLLLGVHPSSADVNQLKYAYNNDKSLAVFQITGLIVSVMITSFCIVFFNITLLHEFMFFVLVIICYAGIKYTVRLVKVISNRNHDRKIYFSPNLKQYKKRKIKPLSPKELHKQEAQW